MNEDKISQYVDRNGVVSEADFVIEHLNRIDKAYQKVSQLEITLRANGNSGKQMEQTIKELATAQKVLESNIKQLTATTKTQADAQLTLAKANKLDADAAEKNAKAKKEEAKAALENAKAKQLENKERQLAAQVAVQEKKITDEITNEYLQLSKAYNDLSLRAKNYYITHGEGHPLTLQAIKDAKELDTFLKKVDTTVGDTRNLRNSKASFDSLGMSLQQLLREMPSLANGLSLFTLAISNNLPQFFDAVKQAKAANAGLAESGQKPIPVFQQIIKSLFSVQSLLTVGVTLLTVYGSKVYDWAASLFKAKTSQEELNGQIYRFNKVAEDSKRRIEALSERLSFLQRLSRINIDIDVTNAPQLDKLQGDLLELRQKSVAQTETTGKLNEELETLRQNSSSAFGAFLRSISDVEPEIQNVFYGVSDLNEAFAKVGDKLPDNAKRMFEAYKTANKDFIEGEKKVTQSQEEQRAIYRQIELQKVNIAKEAAAQRRRLILETITAESDVRKAEAEDVLASDRSSLKQRLEALKNSFAAEKAIIKAQKNDVLNNPESSTEERAAAIKRANAQIKIAQLESLRSQRDEIEKDRIRALNAQKQAFDTQKQLVLENQQEIYQSEVFSLEQRLKAQQAFNQTQRELIEKDFQTKLSAAGFSEKEIEAIKKGDEVQIDQKKITYKELTALRVDYETGILKIAISSNDTLNEILKSDLVKQQGLYEKNVQEIERIYKELDLDTSNAYAKEVLALNDSLQKKKISIEKYNREREKIDEKYEQKGLQNLAGFLLNRLDKLQDAEQKEIAAKQRVNDLKDQLSNATTDEEKRRLKGLYLLAQEDLRIATETVNEKIDLEKQLTEVTIQASEKRKNKTKKDLEEMEQAALKIFDSYLSLLSGLGSADFESNIQEIDAEIEKLEERKQRELEFAEQTIANAQQLEQEKERIEKTAEARRKALENQRRQEQQRQAQFEKEMAVFKIIAETFVAVAKAGFITPTAIAIGIAGAISAALMAAKPLPRYEFGKDAADNYEGLAIWGEKRSELRIRKDGSTEVSPSKPTLTWVDKDDIILPDANKALTAAANQVVNKAATVDKQQIIVLQNNGKEQGYEQLSKDVIQSGRRIENAIKNQPRPKNNNPNDALMKVWLGSSMGIDDLRKLF